MLSFLSNHRDVIDLKFDYVLFQLVEISLQQNKLWMNMKCGEKITLSNNILH